MIFFTKGRKTKNVWIYDGRTNILGITKKDRPLTPEHFREFEECYGQDSFVASEASLKKREEIVGKLERFKKFTLEDFQKRNYNLDIFWLKDEDLDDPDNLPEPLELVTEATAQITVTLSALKELANKLENYNNGEAPNER